MDKEVKELYSQIESHRSVIRDLQQKIYKIELKSIDEKYLNNFIKIEDITSGGVTYMYISSITRENDTITFYGYKFKYYEDEADHLFIKFDENGYRMFNERELTYVPITIVDEDEFWNEFDRVYKNISKWGKEQLKKLRNTNGN